jgi:diphthamide biosynthesis protein 7
VLLDAPIPYFSCVSDTLSEIETAAILDMKWLHPSLSCLSIALANSQVSLYSLQNSTLEHIKSISINSTKALCLSLDWSDRIGGYTGGYKEDAEANTMNEAQAIISQSDGTLATLSHSLSSSSQPVVETWGAHDFEAWIAAYDCWSNGNVVWSGGDDLCLKGWDLRTERIDEQRTPTFTQKRCFEGGVTSIQSHHLRQHLWAAGR